MLLALENAIDALLRSELPALFAGAGAATASFAKQTWDFDRLSADPLAGEPGPQSPANPARRTRSTTCRSTRQCRAGRIC